MIDQLKQPIIIDAKLKYKFDELGIKTHWDALLCIPLRYEDFTKVYKIADSHEGMQAHIEGDIVSAEVVAKRTKQLQVKISDGTNYITLIFFHFYPNYNSQYKVGKKIRVFGEVKLDYYGQKTIIHPKIKSIQENEIVKLSNTFTPIYPSIKGLPQRSILDVVEHALTLLNIPEVLPNNSIFEQMSINQALLTLHKLTPQQYMDNLHIRAIERLKFDEILAQQIVMRNAYLFKHQDIAGQFKPLMNLVKKCESRLPFKLTNAQQRVLNEIINDITKPVQMNRLLQGDVGSGKTIIATLTMLCAVENHYQACILAPTEILAEQHYNKIKHFLAELNICIAWLTGSLTNKEKAYALDKIKSGEAQIIIGTHAIFQKKVEFNNLGLVIVDEQHRFGVKQRLKLQEKATNPHQLMMSATPIPRSLSMSYFADLDVSIIDELPPNRKPITTTLINNGRRTEVIKFINEMSKKSAQVYWVCPLIEESEKLDLENAINVAQELQEELPHLKVGLIHGKLKPQEKANIMQEFLENKIQVLVATTVIEVGVDVPNASIIVIEHSERMGLSQLHQLRGRVGRGILDSTCILLYQQPLGEVARKRLKVIKENTDGFKIAHEDLLIRGAGDLLGDRQSGLSLLRFANLEFDLHLIPIARNLATNLLEINPELANMHTKLWLEHQAFYLKA